ncbi:MAG: hypothetical protein ACKVT0_14675 [Planctomycetaceae bacterium]
MPRAGAKYRHFATFQSLKPNRTANALNEKDWRSDAAWQTALQCWGELDEENAAGITLQDRETVRLDAVFHMRRTPDAVATITPHTRVKIDVGGVVRTFQVVAAVRAGPRELDVHVVEVIS